MSTKQLFPSVAELTKDREGLPRDIDLQGWNSDHPIFTELINKTDPGLIVEVGTWKGRSCKRFADETEGETGVFCIDTWLGGIDHFLSDKPQDGMNPDEHGSPRIYEQFLRNFADHPAAHRIHPVRQTSLNGARALASRGIFADLIYIDGSHEYEDAYADICAYMPLLAPNGVLFGDDYGFPGVQIAVHRYAVEHKRKIKLVDGNFWVFV